MDTVFQDRIDDFLLGRMSEEEKEQFILEVEQDEEKQQQLEFTRNVKDAICSREDKLKELTKFQNMYEEEHHVVSSIRPSGTDYCAEPALHERLVYAAKSKVSHRKRWLWISGIAAVLVVGLFVITPLFESEDCYAPSPVERMRGDDGMFDGLGSAPDSSTSYSDSIANDTIDDGSIGNIGDE